MTPHAHAVALDSAHHYPPLAPAKRQHTQRGLLPQQKAFAWLHLARLLRQSRAIRSGFGGGRVLAHVERAFIASVFACQSPFLCACSCACSSAILQGILQGILLRNGMEWNGNAELLRSLPSRSALARLAIDSESLNSESPLSVEQHRHAQTLQTRRPVSTRSGRGASHVHAFHSGDPSRIVMRSIRPLRGRFITTDNRTHANWQRGKPARRARSRQRDSFFRDRPTHPPPRPRHRARVATN